MLDRRFYFQDFYKNLLILLVWCHKHQNFVITSDDLLISVFKKIIYTIILMSHIEPKPWITFYVGIQSLKDWCTVAATQTLKQSTVYNMPQTDILDHMQ